MAYHILISENNSPEDMVFDHYLGSAQSIDFYWEEVGRKLGLSIISSITERADSEDGFVLEGEKLKEFARELVKFEEYWNQQSTTMDLPANFLNDLNSIKIATELAVAKGLKLMIG